MKRAITTSLLLISLLLTLATPGSRSVAQASTTRAGVTEVALLVPLPPPTTITVTIASGSPTQIVGYNTCDRVDIVATLTTADVNENGEGEPLILRNSSGFSGTLSAYAQATTFSFTATGAGVLSGFIQGFDSDESATVTVTLNSNEQRRFTQAQKDAFARAAAQLNTQAGAMATIAALCAVPSLFPPSSPLFLACTAAAGITSGATWYLSARLNEYALDPSDPNFTVIVQPVFPNLALLAIPPSATPAEVRALNAFNALLINQEQAIGFANAGITSVNRAQGAFDAGNTFWETQQVQAANNYRTQATALLSAEVGLLNELRSSLTAAGFPTLTITSSAALSFENSVLASGLPTAIVQTLTQLGANSAAINQIRNVAIVQDINAVAGNFPQVLTAAGPIGGLQQLVGSFVHIDNPNDFVGQHYHDFLSRDPDSTGLSFWTNEITSCGSNQPCIDVKRINVSAAFFLSIEFQQTGYLVERFYKAAYGNTNGTSTLGGAHTISVPVIRFNEFLPDTMEISQGVVVNQSGWEQVLENNKKAFAAEFVQRSRFTTAYANTLTPAQFVDSLFAKIGVTPSTLDRTAAINEFGTATTSGDVAARGRALRRVAENSTLAQQEFNRAFVLMQYFGYLRRDLNAAPDSDYTGYDFWLTKLNAFNGNFINAEMVKSFLVSTEYQRRFGS